MDHPDCTCKTRTLDTGWIQTYYSDTCTIHLTGH